MEQKFKISKKYVILLLGLITFLLTLIACMIIGYFSSADDDRTYYEIIYEDLQIMTKESGNARFKKLSKMINFGHIVLTKNIKTNKILVHAFDTSSPKIILKNLYDEKSVFSFMNNEFEFSNDVEHFEQNKIYNSPTPCINSFGDLFFFRMIPTVNTIHKNLIKLMQKIKYDDQSHIVVSMLENSIRISSYIALKNNKMIFEMREHFFKERMNNLTIKDIGKHFFYRLFLVNN